MSYEAEIKEGDFVRYEDQLWKVAGRLTNSAIITLLSSLDCGQEVQRLVDLNKLELVVTDVQPLQPTPVTEEEKREQHLNPRSGNQLAIDGIPPANQDGIYVAHLAWRVRVVCKNTQYNGKVFWVSRVNHALFALSRTKEDAKLQNICVYAYAEDCVAVDDAVESAPKPEADKEHKEAQPPELLGCVVTTKDGKSAAVISGATFTSKHKKKKEWYYVLSALTNDVFTEAQLRAKFNIRAAR